MLKPFGLCLEYNSFSVSSLQYIQKVPPYVNGMLNTDVCKRLFDVCISFEKYVICYQISSHPPLKSENKFVR